MSKDKLTPWFPGEVKPVRQGVYQQKSGFGDSIGYQFWDGRQWCGWCKTPDGAENDRGAADIRHQNDRWRGLAQDPKDKP